VIEAVEGSDDGDDNGEDNSGDNNEETKPVGTAVISIDGKSVDSGDTITVPVVSDTTIGSFALKVDYDSSGKDNLILSGVKAASDTELLSYKDSNGVVVVTGADAVGLTTLFNLEFYANATGEADVKITVTELTDNDDGLLSAQTASAVFTVNDKKLSQTVKGDADDNGTVEKKDAALVVGYILGTKELTPQGYVNAECDDNDDVNLLDSIWILNFLKDESGETSNGLAKGTYALNSSLTATGIDYSNANEKTTSAIKIKSNGYILITPAVSGTIKLTYSNKVPVAYVESDTTKEIGSSANSVYTFAVEAGVTYKVVGSSSSSNTSLTALKFE
jgi:hypothetical protein